MKAASRAGVLARLFAFAAVASALHGAVHNQGAYMVTGRLGGRDGFIFDAHRARLRSIHDRRRGGTGMKLSWRPVNAIKHLSWPRRRKPQCWRCIHWTGARSSGGVVCGDSFCMCLYRRARLGTRWQRWWGLRRKR